VVANIDTIIMLVAWLIVILCFFALAIQLFILLERFRFKWMHFAFPFSPWEKVP